MGGRPNWWNRFLARFRRPGSRRPAALMPAPPRQSAPRQSPPRAAQPAARPAQRAQPPRTVPAQRRPPVPPTERSIASKHVSIDVLRTGLVIRRRAGYTGWLPICDLTWAEIRALELDSGTHDAARMLYASIRNSPMRKPLIDQAHLTTEQWVELRDSVADWTGESVVIDLAHLRVTGRSRPYDEL